MVFDPMRCLPLLEQKAGALDQAAPLKGRDLPDGFATPHRLPEARTGKNGKRAYVQILRLPETFGKRAWSLVPVPAALQPRSEPYRDGVPETQGLIAKSQNQNHPGTIPEPSKTFGKPLETYVIPTPRKNAGTIPKPQDIACNQTYNAPVAGGLPDACGRCPIMPVSVGAPPDKPDHALFPSAQEALKSRNGLSGI